MDLPVRMDDGVVLRADEYFPTDPATGAKAADRFPVLLMQTPYGKKLAVQGFAEFFVRRGYVLVIADLRGFGKSQGQAAWFGERIGRDGAELVEWSAKLDEANGKVGLVGCSYLGIVQDFTAVSLGPGSPLKAMAPFCVDSNFYRDLTAFGGIPTQFALTVRAVASPGIEDDPATDPYMQTITSTAASENAYYNDYWRSLNTTALMPKIVALGIPVLTESGWRDIFPGGSLDVEVAAENAANGRPVDAPLPAGSPVSDRYQTIVGDWTHAEHANSELLPVLLSWFDKWLKDKGADVWRTGRPLHLYLAGGDRWIDASSYPLTSDATSFHLVPGPAPGVAGALRPGAGAVACPPPASACARTLLWAPEGPGTTLEFSTEPLTAPLNLAGPGDVTVYVRSNRPEVELTATLFAIDPSGRVRKLTNGAQLGSQRALDPKTSWYSRDGSLVRPSHVFTKEESSPVPVGQSVRLDIELLPALVHVPAGSRLKLVLATQPAENFRQYSPEPELPNILTPTPEEQSNLVGGVYTISFGRDGPSVLNLSTARDEELTTATVNWGPKD